MLDASTPRSGLALPPRPVAKTSTAVKARSASASTRGLKLKRGVSPTPRRSPLELHKSVQECRAEGAQDLEARMRTLESQREHDHAWMLKVSHYVENMSKEAESKAEQSNLKLYEMDRYLKEFTTNGLKLRQELSAVKSGFKELETNIEQKLAGTVDSGISAALERVASSTQSSFLTLEGMLATAFGS
jgi:hypothetical protein